MSTTLKHKLSEPVDVPREMSPDMERELHRRFSEMIWSGIEREHALRTLREASKLLSLGVRAHPEQEEK